MKKQGKSGAEQLARLTEIMYVPHELERASQLVELAQELGVGVSDLRRLDGGLSDEPQLLERMRQAVNASSMAEHAEWLRRGVVVSAIMAGLSLVGAVASWAAVFVR